jgi:hypothetical protein
MKRSNTLGVDWLKANDPQYRTAAEKAAVTKMRRKHAAILGEREAVVCSTVVKRDGRWVQAAPLEPITSASQEYAALQAEYGAQSVGTRRGKRGKKRATFGRF